MISAGTWRVMVVAGVLLSLCVTSAMGIDEKGTRPWSVTTRVETDAAVGGWYVNLGITGARAKLAAANPKVLEVMYVFKRTPADGKLLVGDMIVGIAGKTFTEPHKHGYGMSKFGYEGPMMEFGDALEAAQGGNGKLSVTVLRKDKKKVVEMTIPTKYGRFAPTFPYNCKKTDRILKESYAYLAKRQREDGSWHGRPHINMFAALALLASGDKQYMPNVKRAMQAMARSTNDKIDYGGLDCWKYGLYGAALAEYYLATKEKWVLKELEEINQWLDKSQFKKMYRGGKGLGGWGHRPVDRPGGNGYGPFCMTTAQAMTAWGLMQRCGIKVDQKAYMLVHDFLVKGTNNIGYVWYADKSGANNKYADMGRTGGAVVAHAVSATGGKVFADYAKKGADCIGAYPKTFPDTHASPIIGQVWTSLGAAVDPAAFRRLMDENRWWFALAHCPDGTFIYQPNRDNNPQDYAACPRLSMTAATALILSIKDKRLQMMKCQVTNAGK